MKPSDKIKAKLEKFNRQYGSREIDNIFVSIFEVIIDYLDEEYEKNNECEHKYIVEQEHPTGIVGVCDDCGKIMVK